MKRAQKLLSVFLCIIMMFTMVPMAVLAADPEKITVSLDGEGTYSISHTEASAGEVVGITVIPAEGYGLKAISYNVGSEQGGFYPIIGELNANGSFTGSFIMPENSLGVWVWISCSKYRSLTINAPADAAVFLVSHHTGKQVTDTAMEWESLQLTVSGPATRYTASINSNEIKLNNNFGMFNMPEADATLTVTAITEYVYTEGANSTWDEETAGEATFRINADFNKHVAVYVDDALVAPENYTVSEGSTIITFKPEFLASLAEGEHELTVTFTDGVAVTNFTVEAKEEKNNTVYVPEDDYNDDTDEEKTVTIPSKGIVVISRKDQETAKAETPAEEENPNTGAI